MVKRSLLFLLGSICVMLVVAGCLGSNWNSDLTATPTENDATDTTNQSSSDSTSNSTTPVNEQLPNNNGDSENSEDYTTGISDDVKITLNMDSVSVDVERDIIIDGTTVTITSAGTYSISGTLNDGQIVVDTNDEEDVILVLNGASISSTTHAPIYVENADETVIFLAENTENYLTDSEKNQDNATILSKDDLTICGDGALTVSGNVNDGIRSNDGLVIEGGDITVTSVDDGIRGKDYLVINGGAVTVNSVGDGLKSDNDEEEDKGYIYITAGTVTVTSTKGDAITAQTDLLITGGTFTLTSGGGSNAMQNEAISTKGLKSAVNIVIDGGQFTISSSDDAVHSNDAIVINSGTFNIASGDDGVHADTSLEINGGTLVISDSYEGLESTTITINDGNIQVTASDDGINVAGGNTGNEDFMGGRPGWGGGGGFEQAGNYYIYINGGVIYIDSGGDGLDSNGYIEMTDGLVIINGPTSNMNAAIDYGGGSFQLTGGTILAVGAAGMAQAPSSSTQNVASLRFSSTMSGNELVNIQNESGEDVLTFNPTKTYQSLVYSSPDLAYGTYTVYTGGSSTGTSTYGLYENGTYSGGTELGSFTVS